LILLDRKGKKMKAIQGRSRTRSIFTVRWLALGVAAALLTATGLSRAESPSGANLDTLDPPFMNKINEDGFGQCLNTYSWSMAWFKGNLYVGTNKGSFSQFIFDPEFHCTGQDPDIDPAAEIWKYSPDTDTWTLVFRSPVDVPLWGQPGVFTARDNGFRDMVVFTEPDGTEALYAGGVIYPFLFETRKPRILRSTDGETFSPLPQDPDTVLGEVAGTGYRAMASFQGRLLVTVGSVVGEGVILGATDPAGGNDNFQQVSPPGMLVFELIVFNDHLYVGSGETGFFVGFHVFKTDGEPNGTPYYDFVSIVSEGAYGPYFLGPNNAVLSMAIFQDRLYVGGQNDLIRINPDDTWDLVVGDPRTTPQGPLTPISGLNQGFGNWFTGHLWRMESHEGSLYVGTWDFSVFFRIIPLIGPWIDTESGFDLWKTEDGVHWTNITRNGLDSKFNHGVRSLESTPSGLFLGTVNPWLGTQVYRRESTPLPVRTLTGGRQLRSSGGAPNVLAAPRRLLVESQDGGTVLSWERSPRAARYEIFRALRTGNEAVGVRELPREAWLNGDFTSIGTTVQPLFQDTTTTDGARYTYYVQALGKNGLLSEASNTVIAPSYAPAVTFDRVEAAVSDWAGRKKFAAPASRARVSKYLTAARSAAERGNPGRARVLLAELGRQNLRKGMDPLAAEDLQMMVTRLARRLELAERKLVPVGVVLKQ
jgi:hypothetical protein